MSKLKFISHVIIISFQQDDDDTNTARFLILVFGWTVLKRRDCNYLTILE